MRNYFGKPRTNEIDCPVCQNRTTLHKFGNSTTISTHYSVISGSPEICHGSRQNVKA